MKRLLVLASAALACTPARSIRTVGEEQTRKADERIFRDACRPTLLVGSCSRGVAKAISNERACARQFNNQALLNAAAASGFEPVPSVNRFHEGKFRLEPTDDGLTVQREEGGRIIRSVSLGAVGDECGRTGGPLSMLARDREGKLQLVVPRRRPAQSRIYTECGCVQTCGGAPMPIMEQFADLPEGETLAGRVELPVPHLSVDIRGSERCPPLP